MVIFYYKAIDKGNGLYDNFGMNVGSKCNCLLISLIFLVNFSWINDQNLARRIKDLSHERRDLTPLLTLLGEEEYLGDRLNSNLNLLADIYIILKLPMDEELVKLKLSELKQFYPLLYPKVIKTKVHLAFIKDPLKRQELIERQLWNALPSHVRRNLDSLLQRQRSKQENNFIKWIQENNFSLREALYQLISGLCEPILSQPNPLPIEVIDSQIELGP